MSPRRFKITVTKEKMKEKVKEKKKERREGKEEKKKVMVALLVFIIATLEIVFGGQQEYNTIN